MKVRRTSIPKDSLAAEHRGKLLLVSTHRHRIHVHVMPAGGNGGVFHEFTFEQFCALFERLRDGIAEELTP